MNAGGTCAITKRLDNKLYCTLKDVRDYCFKLFSDLLADDLDFYADIFLGIRTVLII
jgi:hypothetical protein